MRRVGRPPAIPARPGLRLPVLLAAAALAGLGCRPKPTPELVAYSGADLAVVDSLLRPAPVLPTDAFGNPVDRLDRLTIVQWLAERRYEAVDSLLDLRWRLTQQDIRNEGLLYNAFEAFFRGRPDLGPRVNDWVQQRPASGQARLARAYYYLARAEESRGTDPTFTTPADQLTNMDKYAELAARDAAAGMALLPRHLFGYKTLLDVSSLTGGGGPEARARLVNAALTAHPGSFILARTALTVLEPRWGGSIRAMDAVARYGARHRAENPRLVALRALVEMERARMSLGSDDDRSLAHLTRALELGGREYFVAIEAAELDLAERDYLEALRYARLAESQLPQGRTMLEVRGKALLWIAHLVPSPTRDSAFAQSIATFRLLYDLGAPQADPGPWTAYAMRERTRCLALAPPCPDE